MSAAGRRHRPAGAYAAVALAALALVAVVAAATAPGRGNGVLTASTPDDRAALATPPTAVELTFDVVPDPTRSHVVVTDGGGAVNSGPLTATAATLRQPVSVVAPADLTVAYHVRFPDGREAHGQLRFTVGAPAAPAGPDADAGVHRHDVDPLSAALLLVDAAVALAAAGLLLLRRPRARVLPASVKHLTNHRP